MKDTAYELYDARSNGTTIGMYRWYRTVPRCRVLRSSGSGLSGE